MKSFIKFILKIFTVNILKKYKPQIIAITGSYGKTSAKEAIYNILKIKFPTGKTIKNYNNEIGLPCSVIGRESPGKSAKGWFLLFANAFRLLLSVDKNYPKILVLELAIDKPGDMQYLLSLIPKKLIKVAVLTSISSMHFQYFDSLESIAKEKKLLLKNLPKDSYVVLNYDDESVMKDASKIIVKKYTYGLKDGADFTANNIHFSFKEKQDETNDEVTGTNFKLNFSGKMIPIFLSKVIGYPHIYAVLAASVVGYIFELNFVEISQGMKSYVPPKGRLNLIDGIKNTTIIDDTYNASPEGTISSLRLLDSIKSNGKKIAVLGDMLELGKLSIEKHRLVGEIVAKLNISDLILVGEKTRDLAYSAKTNGFDKEHIFHFDNSDRAKKFVQELIEKDDIILVKGSQSMRMEKVVKEIMAEPKKANDLLVRQDKLWIAPMV